MQEKIKWYQEVLELEPGSKVFFPLARLLVQTGQIDDALQTLQHGLARHPEFIEARLYLIDVLFKHNRSSQCNEQVSALTNLFSSYTGFWQAWGAYLAQNEQDKEVALALTFLAASFQNPDLRLADIFKQGLQSLHAASMPTNSAPCAMEPTALAADEPQKDGDSNSLSTRFAQKCHAAGIAMQDVDAQDVSTQQDKDSTVDTPTFSTSATHGVSHAADMASLVSTPHYNPPTVPPLADLVQSLPAPRDHDAHDETASSTIFTDADADNDDSEDGEERFSLRTRSMAEVLAEQGDFKNALDIYQELTAQAVTPEEQLDLQHRISTLTARMGSVQGQPAEHNPTLPEAAPGKHRLLSLLETLAVRFEAHAQG